MPRRADVMWQTWQVALRSVLPAILGAAMAAVAATSAAHEVAGPRGITVSATGEAAGKPDVLRVSLGVTRQARSAAQALDANGRAVSALVARLKQAGVAARDIRTERFDVEPLYEHPQGGGQARISGYRVDNSVVVALRDLDRAGALLDALVDDGANIVHGFRFEMEDGARLEAEARSAALRAARAKAEQYARETGVRLGAVQAVEEAATAGAAPVRLTRQAAMAEAAAVPVEPGESKVQVQVTVRYAIE